jgi:protein-tyrosine phosphatase
MSKILDNLYLGNIEDINNIHFIKNNNIQLIINCASEVIVPSSYDDMNISIINLKLYDDPMQKIYFNLSEGYPSLNDISDKIDYFLKQKKGVLVNCYAGISRSSTFIIAYLMNKYNMNLDDAYSFVINKRLIIKPNSGFLKILKSYEEYLKLEI